MTTRQLFEQALEALKHHREQTRPIFKCDKTIFALEQELAKPDRSQYGSPEMQELILANLTAQQERKHIESILARAEEALDKAQASLNKAQQEQPAPAWHDAPNVPGRWLGSDDSFATVFETGGISIEGVRWYGPIPEDTP